MSIPTQWFSNKEFQENNLQFKIDEFQQDFVSDLSYK